MIIILPIVKFRKMTLEENIKIVKDLFNEDTESLDVIRYLNEYFPDIKSIKDIDRVVTKEFLEYEKKIEREVIRYNSIWSKINDKYYDKLIKYLNTDWDKNRLNIDALVGLIPVFPRFLDSYSFAVSTNLSEEKIKEVTAHETLHFLWFKKWMELYPDTRREELDSPHIIWKYSEIVTYSILNSKEFLSFNFNEKGYESFYKLYDKNNKLIIKELKNIYDKDIIIEDKIKEGYDYIKGEIK